MRTGLARKAAETELRKELQQSYQQLVALISTKRIRNGIEYLEDQRLVDALERQHKTWEEFKNSECDFIGSLSSGASTWQSARSAQCATNLTSQRLKRMRHAVRCVKRIAPEKRIVDQQACMYQLAPLAVPLEED